ncbi:MAG TPA: hypothetical protein VHN79_09095 [Lacunisphaera sp.]|nr:hypothetical protein [Lacunisphaera sp.]
MFARLRFLVVLATLAAATVAVLGWQRHRATELRAEIDRQRSRAAERMRAETERPRPAVAASPAPDAELMVEQAAIAQLRADLEAMQRRVREAAAVRPAPPPETLPLAGNVVAFSLWKHRGRATPEAALETALWSAVNGDTETLASLLLFDPEARNEANALFSSLPENLRREFTSPERLIAFLVAKDVPLGSATILNQFPTPNETRMATQIFEADGKQKVALLSLRPDDAGWRFVVPPRAVKRYAHWVKAPPSVALDPITTRGSPGR